MLAALGLDALRARWPRPHLIVSAAIALLVAAELLVHTLPRLAGRFFAPSVVYATPEAARWLSERAAESGTVRFASATFGPRVNQFGELKAPDNRRLAYLPPNVSAIYPGLDAFQGYLAIRLARSGDLFNAINDVGAGSRLLSIHDPRSELVDVFGVRYFVTDDAESPAERFRPVHRGEQVRIWENPNAYPFAWWTAGLNAETTAPAVDAVARPDARGTVTLLRRGFNAVDLDVASPSAGHAIVNQMIAPGWRAFVDGRRTPLVVANRGQQAVPLNAGRQRVSLRYLPADAVAGAALSGGTAAALALWFFSAARRAPARGAARRALAAP
jgi:hypothetical protein